MATSKKQLEDRVGAVEARMEEIYGGMHGEMESVKEDLGRVLSKLTAIDKIEHLLDRFGADNHVEFRERGKGVQPESSNTPNQCGNMESNREHRRDNSTETNRWEHRPQRRLEMPVFVGEEPDNWIYRAER
ncbi:Uncharacterized protein Adt_49340 [Abeliophyllum distichum]|uniref:Uncharacterized protein n=1 Tax=Abeliophyllum distichum TaxID=126358 RepID=A0ABD1NRF8_9LAMI